MISRTTLQKAADKNIIEAHQVDALYDFLQHEASPNAADESREEPLKFVRSFGDVFITLGIILLLVASNKLAISGYYYLLPATAFVLLAEWLVKRRRLSLPGIAILIAILFFINKALSIEHPQANVITLAVLGISSLLFYLRYHMPFSLLPLALSAVAIFVLQLGLDILQQPLILLVPGLVLFSIAVAFDARDSRRQTHLSDSAFWLHLVASPLIVHSVMVSILLSQQDWTHWLNKEMMMVVFFIGFFLLALLLDRRAMLVSTQLYVIYALTQLLHNNLSRSENMMIYLLMLLGLFVIFFGTYWYKTRRLLFARIGNTAIARYLPDLQLQDNKPLSKPG
jgi:hypothetical protein